MTIELWSLLACTAILYLSITAQSQYLDWTSGVRYAMSNRDEPPPRHATLGYRLDRTVRNHVEGLLIFAPLVIILSAAEISNAWTQGGAAVYGVSRAIHPVAYVLGLGAVRSVIWTGGFLALPAMAWGLLTDLWG